MGLGWLSFLFLDDFEGNANVSAAIKSGSTVSNPAGEAAIVGAFLITVWRVLSHRCPALIL